MRQSSRDGRPAAHLVLIGINSYAPNKYSDRTTIIDLKGSVNDVIGLRRVLQERLQVPDHRVIMLTSPAPLAGVPGCKPATYDNIIAAFKGICGHASAGDQVWIHYSGHGSRLRAWQPERKGDGGRDQALAPADVCTNRRFLRDFELGLLLRAMVDRGLVVTMTIDSCHAPCTLRDSRQQDAEVRYIHLLEENEHLPAEAEAMARVAVRGGAEAWWATNDQLPTGGSQSGLTRDLDRSSGWLDDLRGLVLMAACGVLEGAKEICHGDEHHGEAWRGAFSHWLITALQEADATATVQQLYRLVLAQVHGSFISQTPQLEGELGRRVFSTEAVPFSHSITVLNATAHDQLMLHAGRSQLVTPGARLAIYPRLAVQLDNPANRLAIAEVTSAGACSSVARISTTNSAEPVRAGDQAVLIDPGAAELRAKVHLDPAAERELAAPSARHTVRTKLEQWPSQQIEEVGNRDQADHLVVIREGRYLLCNPDGEPVPHVGLPLPVNHPDAAAELRRRLEHLARYQALAKLRNPTPDCPIAGCLEAKMTLDHGPLTGNPAVSPAGSGYQPERLTLVTGQQPSLRLVNRSTMPLYVVVLDLRPDWSISQILPSKQGTAAHLLEAGQEHREPLRASLPPGFDQGSDLLKVIATTRPPSFRWTELPALDSPERRHSRSNDSSTIVLADQLSAFQRGAATHKKQTANPDPAAQPDHWTTAELEIEVVHSEALPTAHT